MDIKRSGSQPSAKGPAEYFTGTVRVDPLFQAPDPSRVIGALVTFEPGARTAWHTHPLGQNLIVTSGCGWAQRWGGPVEEIQPGEKHWHGATLTMAMTHIAIQEHLDGKTADWMEEVSAEQYQAGLMKGDNHEENLDSRSLSGMTEKRRMRLLRRSFHPSSFRMSRAQSERPAMTAFFPSSRGNTVIATNIIKEANT